MPIAGIEAINILAYHPGAGVRLDALFMNIPHPYAAAEDACRIEQDFCPEEAAWAVLLVTFAGVVSYDQSRRLLRSRASRKFAAGRRLPEKRMAAQVH